MPKVNEILIRQCTDWVIDLGPGDGESGGYIVAQGPPEDIAKNSKFITGKYLKTLLVPNQRSNSPAAEDGPVQ